MNEYNHDVVEVVAAEVHAALAVLGNKKAMDDCGDTVMNVAVLLRVDCGDDGEACFSVGLNDARILLMEILSALSKSGDRLSKTILDSILSLTSDEMRREKGEHTP